MGNSSEPEVLSKREKEIVSLLANGYTNRQVANKLGLLVGTVENYRLNIMRKLNLDRFPDLVKYAIRTGLTSLDDQRKD